ncbi:MAG TPA: sodium/glutamate symporter [Vicinamibacterales bacterium]|nr:sodium/glutamate symporter [Vicinamibacterales bacterium]
MLPIALDLVQTVAFAGVILFAGYGVRRLIPALGKVNIPAPVCGGLPVAGVLAVLYFSGIQPIKFDTALQVPFQNTFFASIGFAASLALLRKGGPLVFTFFILAFVVAVMQNVLGWAVAWGLGQHPLMGVLAGSVTLTGGPATGLAFAPLFEQAGVPGAATLAVAAAMVGIVSGGVIGGPIGTYLVERKLRIGPGGPGSTTLANVAEEQVPQTAIVAPAGEDVEAYVLMKHLVLLVVTVGLGIWVSRWLTAFVTLPAYIGAMLVAALIRNLDDMTGVFKISMRVIDDIGAIALSLFLVMALMTLRLWELAGLVIPLLIILAAQVALIAAICVWVVPRVMGRDYDSAVMSGGFAGFMLGTSANAMANMGALVERYGAAPKAFLVVPLVGAFFIDFANALLITFFVNLWQ